MLIDAKYGLVFAEDDGKSGGGQPEEDKTEVEAKQPEKTQQPGEEAKIPEQSGKVEFTQEQQVEIERIIKDRLQREKEKGKKAEEKARKDAEIEVLKKAEEWKSLAGEYEQQLISLKEIETKLESEKARADRYEKALTEQLKTLEKDIPNHIKVLMEKLDPVERFEYLLKNQDQLKTTNDKKPIPETPRPDGSGGKQVDENAKKSTDAFYRMKF